MKKRKSIIIILSLLLVILVTGIVIFRISNKKVVYNATDDYFMWGEEVENICNFTASTSETLLYSEENMCYSPISLYSSVCLSTEFMSENVRNEMLNGLGFKDIGEMESNYESIAKKIGQFKDDKIIIANSLWIKDELKLENTETNIENIKKKVYMDVFCNDFTGNEVNKWICDKTEGLINMQLETQNPVVLANAMYFRDNWQKEFEVIEKKEKFRLTSGNKIKVDYMESKGRFQSSYVRGKGYIAVKVYFDSADMIFVLPDDNLKDIVNSKTVNEIMATYSSNKSNPVDLKIKLPMFKTESELSSEELEKALKNVGLGAITNIYAWSEFIKIDSVTRIDIAQKTCLNLDEKGVEATAATTIIPSIWGDEEDVKTIKLNLNFDRPFMYIVEKDNIPLFIGTVYNPTE